MTLLKSLFLKMGNGNSKARTKETRGGKKKGHQLEMQQKNNSNFSTEFGAAYDPELSRMRASLERDQQGFILNNLMLCVQFFENYEKEILDIRANPISRKEHDLNTILSQSQKRILLPDVLQEQVARHVKFTSTRRTGRLTVEPLQPVRLFIVLDNVEVNEVAEGPEYCSVRTEATFYHMCLEPSHNNGFVKLRSLEVTPAIKAKADNGSDSDLSSIAEDEDEIYNTNEDMFNPRSNPGARFLSKVEKRANSLAQKPAFSQSMTDLHNSERVNGDGFLSKNGRTNSQTNLVLPQRPDDEDGPSERRLSGRIKPPSSAVLRGQLGTNPKLNHSKGRQQNANQNPQKSSSYKTGPLGNNYVIDSDSDYGYATITNFNTPKPLLRPANIPISSSEIPASCFKKIVYTRDGKVYSEKAEKLEQSRQQKRIRMALKRQNEDRLYLRSDQFMFYFQDLFANRLAQPLGFETDDVDDASRQGAIIYCDSMQLLEKNRMLIIPHEIAPSIPADWPKCGNEWLHRQRPEVLDPGNNIIYIWPTKKMIQKVQKFGCHIIPEGYMPKRQTNPNHALEWQLAFPAAERYLETCLSHSQARVYMMALMLHKTFIRSVDTTFGLTTSHIRTQLFWLLEQNYTPSMWPENRAGESLRRLLKKLYSAVSQSQPCLPDYFISKKNLWANIPKQYLLLTQKQLNRIIENPVMYVIASMENIRYKPKFFPILDYKRLHKLLTLDNRNLVAFINPALANFDGPMPQPETEDNEKFEEQYDRIGGFWVKVKTKEKPSNDRNHKSIQYKNVINNSNSVSQDLVVEISDQCAELRGLRLAAFLEMFIEHFTKMAEHCYKYGAMKQKDIYLNQAERLSMILYDLPNEKDDAQTYLDKINTLRTELARAKAQEDAPETPKRNDQPLASVPLNQHFTNESGEPGIALYVPRIGETKEYDIYYAPTGRRTTVNFQDRTTQMDNDGTITIGEVNDTRPRMGANGPRVVNLTEGIEEITHLTDSTYI